MNMGRAILIATILGLFSTGIGAADVQRGVAQAPDRAEAMNRMGILYATGTGVPQDYVAALAWYRRAAENGSAQAMNNIATIYFHGLGVAQSYEESVKWLRLAVKQGDAVAQNKLGSLYDVGLGVPKSAQDSFELFSLAAAQGYAPGMANLGRAYAGGRGVKRDEIHGYALISAAIQLGVSPGERDAALFELGALSQRLDSKQIERAETDARALLETRSKDLSAKQDDAGGAYRL
ncbi:MAG TPA: tetratricopeptide repeat protein [Steroidobacteraceae bacterium]|jgi:TPR repeat protein|nr:tetratricopeptide repeat protein [Steroidobacteraceae bacterium]